MYPRRRPAQYGRYHDGPDPLAPPVDLQEALSQIGEDVMAGYSPERAMQEYLRRGGRDRQGLDDLARQVQQRRAELLRRHNLDGTLNEVKQLLDEAVLAERKQLARDLDDDARFAEMRIAELPTSPAAAVTELSNYDWRSTEARQKYEQIKDLLGREFLDQHFRGMKQALANATDEDRAEVRRMLADLNDLLDKHRRGEDTEQDFADFMAEHGRHFPENPQNIDELIDALAQRSAAAQRMLNSMSAEQRAELMELAQQAFGSPDLMNELGRLGENLQAMRPGEDWTGAQRFSGEQGLGLGDGTGALQDLADLDDLAEQLSQSYPGARLDDIDLDAVRRQFGEEGRVAAETLQELDKALRDSGYLNRASDGQLKLTPQAMRRLGRQLLKDAAGRLSARQGQRDTRLAGAAGEQTGASREWQFGDTEPWDVTDTITSAVHRTVAEGGDPTELRIDVRDIRVHETEARTRSAVALLVDTSFSMVMDG
ncbi:MAG: hypothetical protein GXX86_00455, partial [Propionibacterium sp.]|nr:hypothetical protein [Propionibacterium sp.]